jgi:hypothetical protein
MKKLILVFLFTLYSCSKLKKRDIIIFECKFRNGNLVQKENLHLTYVVVDDSTFEVTNFAKSKVKLRINSKGISQLKETSEELVYSFNDSLPRKNFISPIDSSISKLNRIKTYNVSGKTIKIFEYKENYFNSDNGYFSYFSPGIGFIIYYLYDTGTSYERKFIRSQSGWEILNILKNDSTFYIGNLLKNPVLDFNKVVIPSDIK